MHHRQQKTNKQLASTTEKLQEEKLRLDALLVRQYNLIEVLGKPHRRGCRTPDDAAGTPDGSTSDGLEGGLTLGALQACADCFSDRQGIGALLVDSATWKPAQGLL